MKNLQYLFCCTRKQDDQVSSHSRSSLQSNNNPKLPLNSKCVVSATPPPVRSSPASKTLPQFLSSSSEKIPDAKQGGKGDSIPTITVLSPDLSNASRFQTPPPFPESATPPPVRSSPASKTWPQFLSSSSEKIPDGKQGGEGNSIQTTTVSSPDLSNASRFQTPPPFPDLFTQLAKIELMPSGGRQVSGDSSTIGTMSSVHLESVVSGGEELNRATTPIGIGTDSSLNLLIERNARKPSFFRTHISYSGPATKEDYLGISEKAASSANLPVSIDRFESLAASLQDDLNFDSTHFIDPSMRVPHYSDSEFEKISLSGIEKDSKTGENIFYPSDKTT